MDKEDLMKMLMADSSPAEIAAWLRQEYLPYLISRFNVEDVRKRLGLYMGERIPDNERNLTDVRNRVSLIIEYELARLSNDILKCHEIDSFFWCYVVANRFPDLEVRKNNGERCLRIEVKCLQSIAEEKSANFDTLIKDINPNTDYVVVFLWEWFYMDGVAFSWDRAPKILGSYVFHAASLAKLRDTYWLNKPPADMGSGWQGFDLRYAVNCKEGVYSEEEGNYGKLLRIWQEGFEYRPIETVELLDTERAYIEFKNNVVLEGFKSLCEYHLQIMCRTQIENIHIDGEYVGAKCGEYGFVFKSRVGGIPALVKVASDNNLRFIVSMTDKYVSTGYELIDNRLVSKFSGLKPKLLNASLFSLDAS